MNFLKLIKFIKPFGARSADEAPDKIAVYANGDVNKAESDPIRRKNHSSALSTDDEFGPDAENSDLPLVGRKSGNKKLVTNLGFVFILGAMLIVYSTIQGNKIEVKAEKPREQQTRIELPALVMPDAPAQSIEPNAVPLLRADVAMTVPGSATAVPIPIRGATQLDVAGKSPADWLDRKMGGRLLVNEGMVGSEGGSTETSNAALAGAGTSGQRSTPAFKLTVDRTLTDNDSSTRASLLADRNFLITKGTSLDCALETALDSSLSGLTTCRLTRDAYSTNGQVVLLDRGSRLVGEYQGAMKQGQTRLFVLWTRVETPNGVIISLNSPGTDYLGRSGLDGFVDNHFIERFGAAILLSFISDSVSALGKQNSGGDVAGVGVGAAVPNKYGNAVSSSSRIVQGILDSNASISPTLRKNQGEHIQIMVAKDLDFSATYALKIKD